MKPVIFKGYDVALNAPMDWKPRPRTKGEMMDYYQDETRESAERLAALAKAAGRSEAMNEVLRWAVEHRAQLDRAGLTEALIAVCTSRQI